MDWIMDLDGDSPVLQFIGKYAYKIYAERDTIKMHIHLILAALFPIYIGSHASLRRPPSAALPEQSKSEDDDDDDEIEVEPTVEGLRPSDAIMFPALAGCTLGGLYLLIKWLNDPALLNKVLGYYFSLIGVFGVGKLAADCLNVATTFVFPSVWSSRGTVYHIDPLLSQQVTGQVKQARVQLHRSFTDKSNPFPGFLSSIQFPESVNKQLWALRALLKKHWIFRGYLHGAFNYKTKLQINDVMGFILGIVAIVLYNTSGKAWWLTNIISFGFCYGTLQLLSPITFWTGSMVLVGLFIYDIVMVFYTPLMLTVATSLDVPIKLVFPGPKRGSMLGLGDVVIPGIMMALALRFDLYLHYLSKQTKPASGDSSSTIKATYVEAFGKWGDRFWTSGAKNAVEKTVADGSRFPKVYFKASLVGYTLGMLASLIVLHVFKHAQPALLYLVPGVLVSLWGTALVRRELGLMWGYTEEGSLDDNEEGPDGKKQREKGGGSASNENADAVTPTTTKEKDQTKERASKERKAEEEHSQHVFLFSLSTPKRKTRLPKLAKFSQQS
jgi:minor histocompatibility antigen H13